MDSRILLPKELKKLDLDERIKLLDTRLNLGKENIRKVQCHTDYEAIVQAGVLIYKSLKNKGYSKKVALNHVTSSLIEPLIPFEENYTKSVDELVSNVAKYFKWEVKEFAEQYDIKLNSPNMLRREVYQRAEGKELVSNILKTKETWGDGIEFSQHDLLKGKKVRPININQAIILGLATVGATVTNNIHQSHYEVRFNVREHEKRLFYDVAIPIFSDQFNEFTNGEKPIKETRDLRLQSQLILSYFKHKLKFSNTIEHRKLIDFSKLPTKAIEGQIEDIEKAYFVGLLAKKLKASNRGGERPYSAHLMITHNPTLLHQINDLAHKLGYNTTVGEASGRLRFNVDEFPKLINDDFLEKIGFEYQHKGLIINPYTIQQLNSEQNGN